MDKVQIAKALKQVREKAKERKFKQSFDLIINLKGLDLKKPEHRVELFSVLPKGKGKKARVCALVGQELVTPAKKACDKVITDDEFEALASDKKALKALVNSYDFFIAQANIMTKIAASFGKVFGPRGKMPNPKAGAIVPPKGDVETVYKRLQNTIRLVTKNELSIKCLVGMDDMDDKDVTENVMHVYNTVLHALPHEKQNIKNVLIKLTMGSPIEVGGAKNG